ncbi:MAG: ptsI [Firmicutes bacterium]|nr:ptsI [Bacillota bacterium]
MLFQGISGSGGIEIGQAYIYQDHDIHIDKRTISPGDIDGEIDKLRQALCVSHRQIQSVREKALQKVGEDNAKIFDAHVMIVEDPAFLENVITAIKEEKLSAAAALERVTNQYGAMFAEMDDEYMRERGADIKDVGDRVLRNLLGIPPRGVEQLTEEVIIIAHDLTPSDTISFDARYVKGFATNIGGRTSHAAIIARTLEIPAVLGLKEITSRIKSGDVIIIDGNAGKIHSCPDAELIAKYQQKRKAFFSEQIDLKRFGQLPAVTMDGKTVEISANIGAPQDIEMALIYGADGVGLYRTEFLFLGKCRLPSEDEQYYAYKTVAEKLGKKPLIIRTLDIGGDKELSYLGLSEEMNPFMGYRAIRICLDKPEIFKMQLSAILRASIYGNIMIMYPMISGISEVKKANAVLAEVKQDLRDHGTLFDEDIKVGIMIEIPSAAITADKIIQEVDFFSIGTNDLCQYTLAVDRMNEKVSYLYQPLHPAVLRLIKNSIEASHKYGKFTGMCGELAGEPLAVSVLLGLGLDEFSMSASSIPRVKKVIRSITYNQAREIADMALSMETHEEIINCSAVMLKKLGVIDTGGEL